MEGKRHRTATALFRLQKRSRRLARDNARLRVILRALIRQNNQLRTDITQRETMQNYAAQVHVPIIFTTMSTEHEAIKALTNEISVLRTSFDGFECLLRGNLQLRDMNQARSEVKAGAPCVQTHSKPSVRKAVTERTLARKSKVLSLLAAPDPPPPPLWKACDRQCIEEVRHLLRLSTTSDIPGPDGTTAFALSLAQLNTDQTLAILESGIEPREDILFCAREFVKLQLTRPEERELQSAVSSRLGGNIGPSSFTRDSDCSIDKRYAPNKDHSNYFGQN